MRIKEQAGLSLLELMVALSLLSLVLAIAYGFYSFSGDTISLGEQQSNLQQTVNLAADFITNELRYATGMTIINSTEIASIPDAAQIGADNYYMFINSNSKIELRQRNASKVLFDPAQFGINFDSLVFTKVTDKTLGLTVSASRKNDANRTFVIDTKILAENMNLSTESIGGHNSGAGVHFSKGITYTPPAFTNTSVLVSPNLVTTSPTFDRTFELTLTASQFNSPLQTHQFSLANDFSGLTIANVTRISDQQASVRVSGNLVHSYGIGIINIAGSALTTGSPLIAGVIIESNVRRLTMAVHPPNRGTVTPASGTHNYTLNEHGIATVAISATPSSPWQFRHWLINGIPFSDANRTLEMENHTTATAVFMIPLAQIRGGNYVRHNGINYLKLTGSNNLVLQTTASQTAVTWSNIQHRDRLPLRSELERDSWTDAIRDIATSSYWTRTPWGQNHMESVESNGAFGRLHTNNASGAVFLTKDLGSGLFATEGSGTANDPFILFAH
ncbi:MAG: prepilin-type N-terminal cleavage/methylation domain-containing protein [Clostridium sp.]|nr:prepilin-type N-terminal cleavage/methylation domain-containing protein [Clostridium sp.]